MSSSHVMAAGNREEVLRDDVSIQFSLAVPPGGSRGGTGWNDRSGFLGAETGVGWSGGREQQAGKESA